MKRVGVCALVCGCVVAAGCVSWQDIADTGLMGAGWVSSRGEQQLALEQEQERLAAQQAESDRLAAEQAAADAEESKLREQYADGPSTPEHGRRGFLWKPKSDNDGLPVVIFPPRFTNKTRLVTVNGVALRRSSVANGYREHFRMKRHYAGPVTVQAEASDGPGGKVYRWTWIVQDPASRNDSNITPRMDAL